MYSNEVMPFIQVEMRASFIGKVYYTTEFLLYGGGE
jgi:hypothetical protein